jgi:enoyl-CoA hydratase/carnithine racemase
MYEDIRYEVTDPVAVITLNRPQAMNAWTETMDREVRDALGRAAADRSVVGIVITGEGRAFCAGADMKTLSALSNSDASQRPDAGQTPTEPSPSKNVDERISRRDGDFDGRFPYLMAIDKPIIAAVNGAVAGMAFPFTLCCDFRVVTPDAVFLTAFAQRGLIAEWGLSWLLPRLVGPSVAMDLLISSRKVRGDEALRIGLANYLVDADQLLPFCRDYIEKLATACSPSSIAVMKRQVYEQLHSAGGGLGVAELDSRRLMAESFERPDFAEGVKSFLEKRAPVFARLPLDPA